MSYADETELLLLIEPRLLGLLASFAEEFRNYFLDAVERLLNISTPYKPDGFKLDSYDTLKPLFLPKKSSLGLCIRLLTSFGEYNECSEADKILF